MLGTFASANLISAVYVAASILSLILVTIAPHIVRTIGNFKYVALSLLASSTLLYLISKNSGSKIVPLFILYFSLNSLVLYGLDLFLEHYSKESQTGNIRGLYLTLGNIGWVVAPIISGTLETKFGFPIIYLVAAISVAITLCVVFFSQRGFVDKIYPRTHFIDGMKMLLQNKDLRKITFLNFLLQFFFVIMVIYSPVYLTSVIGFSWKTLGIILSIMLIPFVVFPFPSGYIADKFLGEKELMFGALILMGGATIYFTTLGHSSFLIYAGILFLTRMGASIFETMCDSTFFKRVTDADSAVISTYRNMMPMAYVVGPLIGAAVFNLTSYTTLFICLGILMIVSSLYVLRIKDTK
jgi:predicted MFS family arabinose efflux permease